MVESCKSVPLLLPKPHSREHFVIAIKSCLAQFYYVIILCCCFILKVVLFFIHQITQNCFTNYKFQTLKMSTFLCICYKKNIFRTAIFNLQFYFILIIHYTHVHNLLESFMLDRNTAASTPGKDLRRKVFMHQRETAY